MNNEHTIRVELERVIVDLAQDSPELNPRMDVVRSWLALELAGKLDAAEARIRELEVENADLVAELERAGARHIQLVRREETVYRDVHAWARHIVDKIDQAKIAAGQSDLQFGGKPSGE